MTLDAQVRHAKRHGGPWRCPTCGRATVTVYRCANFDCGSDLAGKPLEAIEV